MPSYDLGTINRIGREYVEARNRVLLCALMREVFPYLQHMAECVRTTGWYINIQGKTRGIIIARAPTTVDDLTQDGAEQVVKDLDNLTLRYEPVEYIGLRAVQGMTYANQGVASFGRIPYRVYRTVAKIIHAIKDPYETINQIKATIQHNKKPITMERAIWLYRVCTNAEYTCLDDPVTPAKPTLVRDTLPNTDLDLEKQVGDNEQQVLTRDELMTVLSHVKDPLGLVIQLGYGMGYEKEKQRDISAITGLSEGRISEVLNSERLQRRAARIFREHPELEQRLRQRLALFE